MYYKYFHTSIGALNSNFKSQTQKNVQLNNFSGTNTWDNSIYIDQKSFPWQRQMSVNVKSSNQLK